MESKVLGIIPARAGSTRVKSKNKRLLGGKPLILHVVEQAIKAKKLNKIVITSDDEEILEMCKNFNVQLIRRPASISGAKAQASEYVKHAFDILSEDFSHFCIIPATSPFTLATDIDATVSLAINEESESAVSVMKLDHAIHPYKLKTLSGKTLKPFIKEEDGKMADFELPDIYVRNCSVYVSRKDVVYKYNQIIGKDMKGYIMPPERSLDINEEIDFEFAEFLYQKVNNQINN